MWMCVGVDLMCGCVSHVWMGVGVHCVDVCGCGPHVWMCVGVDLMCGCVWV